MSRRASDLAISMVLGPGRRRRLGRRPPAVGAAIGLGPFVAAPGGVPMTFERCAFETERLTVAEWRIDPPADLPSRVATVLTAATTSFLPPHWQGDYSEQRARTWIAERDAESPTLLVTDRASGATVGLVILFEEPRPAAPDLIEARPAEAPTAAPQVDVRLGYVLAESQWGRGLASELVAGLVEWCRGEPSIASIAGGVEVDNVASARVLVKTGFALVESSTEGGEELYRLELG